MIQLILLSLIGGMFSLVGGLLLLWKESLARKFIAPLLAFAAGTFLSVIFLHIIPEAIESGGDAHEVLLFVLVGFVSFFIIERYLMKYVFQHAGKHDHSEHTETLPLLLIITDSIHNFLDGVMIALAYVANPSLGFLTTIAVAAHEIPQEIGEFSILLHKKWKKKHIIASNILQSLLTIPGVIIGYYGGYLLEPYLPYLLGATAGVFLYISGSELIPEIHHQAGHSHFRRTVFALLLGVFIIWIFTTLTHH